jgi:hypothetical protein
VQEKLGQKGFHTVPRAAGETETMQENIQDWLQLNQEDPGYLLLTKDELAADIFYLLQSSLPI